MGTQHYNTYDKPSIILKILTYFILKYFKLQIYIFEMQSEIRGFDPPPLVVGELI